MDWIKGQYKTLEAAVLDRDALFAYVEGVARAKLGDVGPREVNAIVEQILYRVSIDQVTPTIVDEEVTRYGQVQRLLEMGLEVEPPPWMEKRDIATAYGRAVGYPRVVQTPSYTVPAPSYGVQTPSKKIGGGIMRLSLMERPLSLRGQILATATLGDLLALLEKVQDPTDEVKKATELVKDMVAKYEEKAEAEDVKPDRLKKVLNFLKDVPKPTEDRPRTRVQRAIKMLEKILGGEEKVSASALSDILELLEKIEEPEGNLKEAKELIEELVKKESGAKYGRVVDAGSLKKLLELLEKSESKPEAVNKAIRMLKKLLGEGEKPKANLPGYGVSKLEAGKVPGVYKLKLIQAGPALDGKNWTETALKDAVERGVFEGVPINVYSYTGRYGNIEHHMQDDSPFIGKTVGNQVGFIKDVTWSDDDHAAYGFGYVTDDMRQALIDAMLAEGVEAPGLSIFANGTMDDEMNVQFIDSAMSFDMVTFPAANGGVLSKVLSASVHEWGVLQILKAAGEQDLDLESAKSFLKQIAGEIKLGIPEASAIEQRYGVAQENWLGELVDELIGKLAQAMLDTDAKTVWEAYQQLYQDGSLWGETVVKWADAWAVEKFGEAQEQAPGQVPETPPAAESLEAMLTADSNAIVEQAAEDKKEAVKTALGALVQALVKSVPGVVGEQLKALRAAAGTMFKAVARALQAAAAPPTQQPELNLPPAGTPPAAPPMPQPSTTAASMRLSKRIKELEEREALKDSSKLLDVKLEASGLPALIQESIREALEKQVLSAALIDGTIAYHKQLMTNLSVDVSKRTAIPLEAALNLPSMDTDGDGELDEALRAYLKIGKGG